MTAETEREHEADRRELAAAAEQVDDHPEADQRERERDPDAPPHVLVEDVAGPQRDEQRSQVLDQQRDPDGEPVDREEVEPLHEREPADPEDGEERQLAPRGPEARGRDHEQDEHEPDRGAERSHLEQPQRREVRAEDHLRHGPVDGPEDRRRSRHGVPDPRAPMRGRLDRKRRLAHGAAIYGPRRRALH